jgi:hypothetical protein
MLQGSLIGSIFMKNNNNLKINIMNYDKYQSNEWVNVQIEMEEDENSGSIMDEFKINKNINK